MRWRWPSSRCGWDTASATSPTGTWRGAWCGSRRSVASWRCSSRRSDAWRAALLGVLSFATLPAFAALRANYEVELNVDGSVHGARTSTAVRSGVALINEFDRFEVRLLPRVDANGFYELDV